MSLLSRLFGSPGVEIPEGSYDVQGYHQGTNFSDFAHSEIEGQLECCDNPDPFTETCELPRSEMYYDGICRNCGEDYKGLISIEVTVHE
jgi:hypothetical protein